MNQSDAHEIIKSYSDIAPQKEKVEKMFDEIAHSYDALNHILSLGIDWFWRKSAIKYLRERSNPDSILDVATGTGDLAILANKILKPKKIVGIDISEKMLEIGNEKIKKMRLEQTISLLKEDCSHLPFPSNHFDAIISSFGLRNFEKLDTCLSELFRVLKSGGEIVVIDLCSPHEFPIRQLFWCYKKIIMPFIGKKISHNNHAYTYLPHSMDIIPQGEEMAKLFTAAGFKYVKQKKLVTQMCIQYSGIK